MSIPHIEHLPALSAISPGCMGHLYKPTSFLFNISFCDSVRSIPQDEHLPALSLVTSGCIGQEYVLTISFFNISFFERAKSLPHVEHFPGLSLVISGCIGQEYVVNTVPSLNSEFAFAFWATLANELAAIIIKMITCFIVFVF